MLVTACSLGTSADPKFAEASYRIEGAATSSEGTPPVQTIIYRNGPKIRVETTLASGASSMVSDTLSGESYIVTPAGLAAAPAPRLDDHIDASDHDGSCNNHDHPAARARRRNSSHRHRRACRRRGRAQAHRSGVGHARRQECTLRVEMRGGR